MPYFTRASGHAQSEVRSVSLSSMLYQMQQGLSNRALRPPRYRRGRTQHTDIACNPRISRLQSTSDCHIWREKLPDHRAITFARLLEGSALSESLFSRARDTIPGGVNSPVRAFGSVGGTPRFVSRAEGAHVFDSDGRRYVDLVSIILWRMRL